MRQRKEILRGGKVTGMPALPTVLYTHSIPRGRCLATRLYHPLWLTNHVHQLKHFTQHVNAILAYLSCYTYRAEKLYVQSTVIQHSSASTEVFRILVLAEIISTGATPRFGKVPKSMACLRF